MQLNGGINFDGWNYKCEFCKWNLVKLRYPSLMLCLLPSFRFETLGDKGLNRKNYLIGRFVDFKIPSIVSTTYLLLQSRKHSPWL
jgi:hypothetical protein